MVRDWPYSKELFHQADGRTASRAKHRETTIWQRRFWEHLVHDYADFERHFNYIHYNPVKHGLVSVLVLLHKAFERIMIFHRSTEP
jgi:REP element-mobilizing transposase RayT